MDAYAVPHRDGPSKLQPAYDTANFDDRVQGVVEQDHLRFQSRN